MKSILFCSLVFMLFSCTTSKVYFSYASSPEEILIREDGKGPKIRMVILPEMIRDCKLPTVHTAKIQFASEYQYYPRSLQFELFENDILLTLAPAEITLTTVIDGSFSNFKTQNTFEDIEGLLTKFKTENKIPSEVHYFSLSANIKAQLTNTNCTETIPLKLKVRTENTNQEKLFIFKLGERQYGSASNRPYG